MGWLRLQRPERKQCTDILLAADRFSTRENSSDGNCVPVQPAAPDHSTGMVISSRWETRVPVSRAAPHELARSWRESRPRLLAQGARGTITSQKTMPPESGTASLALIFVGARGGSRPVRRSAISGRRTRRSGAARRNRRATYVRNRTNGAESKHAYCRSLATSLVAQPLGHLWPHHYSRYQNSGIKTKNTDIKM